jgi:hypothetical protein
MKKKKTEPIGLKTTVALIVIILLVGTGGTMIAYTLYDLVFVKTFDISFEISPFKIIGINADPTLDFGKVPVEGSSSVKYMNLLNDNEFPVFVEIEVKGNASPFVTFEDTAFELKPGEYRKLRVSVNVAGSPPLGSRTGQATVIFRRIKHYNG